jgi:hypothetical protein
MNALGILCGAKKWHANAKYERSEELEERRGSHERWGSYS